MTEVTLRAAGAGDLPFLCEVLADALAWREGGGQRTVDEVLAHPQLARFLEGWPLPGDAGVVAELPQGPVGGAWYRRMSDRDDGYGYLSDSIPVVTVGIRPPYRGRGIGGVLLAGLTERARADGVGALSLSADTEHPAIALYRKLGFVQVGGHGGGITMLLELP